MGIREQAKWHGFLSDLPTRSYPKGNIVIFQGEAPQAVYIVKSGTLKAYNISDRGDKQLFFFHAKSDVFPLSWVIGNAPSALFYYETISESELYYVSKEKYLDFLKNDHMLLMYELERYVKNDVGKTMRINALLNSSAREKLIHTIHYLAQSYGVPEKDHSVKIELELTHQDYASLTGITRETAATELNKLRKAGVISYDHQSIYSVNLVKINKILNDQFITASQELL